AIGSPTRLARVCGAKIASSSVSAPTTTMSSVLPSSGIVMILRPSSKQVRQRLRLRWIAKLNRCGAGTGEDVLPLSCSALAAPRVAAIEVNDCYVDVFQRLTALEVSRVINGSV